ncbi:MAG: hypothetical protein ABR572_08465 [Cryomorphaceae bacterium]|nr:hypothetical protein [Flavobacteriales bacterium]
MKPLIKLCSAFALLLATVQVQAQSKTATLHMDGTVEVPAEEITDGNYDIDISDFDFQDDAEAIEYFRNQGGESHFYRPVLSQNRAVLYLKIKNHPDHDAAQWNDYLSDKKLPIPAIQPGSAAE